MPGRAGVVVARGGTALPEHLVWGVVITTSREQIGVIVSPGERVVVAKSDVLWVDLIVQAF